MNDTQLKAALKEIERYIALFRKRSKDRDMTFWDHRADGLRIALEILKRHT